MCSLRKAKGFAPEKDASYGLMQQFPQKTSEQQSQTSYFYLREYFYFFAFQTRCSLFCPFSTSCRRNRLKARKTNISACISTNKSRLFYSVSRQYGKLLVPSATAATQQLAYQGQTNASAATTTKVPASCSFLNFFLQAYRKRCQAVSLMFFAISSRVVLWLPSIQQQFNSKISIFEAKMQILMLSEPSTPDDTLHTLISPSSIRLRPKNSLSRDQTKTTVLQRYLPSCGTSPLIEQGSNPEYSLQENSGVSQQMARTPKRREGKIFSLVHSEKRDSSATQTSNSSALKQRKQGIRVLSRQKKRSPSKKREEEAVLKNLESFTVASDSLNLGQEEKENRCAVGVKIRQPQFLKAHPLRMGKINGSCMGKLIVQRALQERQHCFINKNNPTSNSYP